MNAGMRDAINLAGKLPMVMSGEASPALLETYQAKRHVHTTDLVDSAVAIGQLMEHLPPRKRPSAETKRLVFGHIDERHGLDDIIARLAKDLHLNH